MEMVNRDSNLPANGTILIPSPSFESTETPKVETTVINDFEDFPEGGARAWASAAGSFLMVFISQGAIYAFGVYQDYYTRIFLSESSPSKIAWIGSLQLFLLFFLALFAGKLFDDGYFYHLTIIGSVIYIFSFFMLSLAQPQHYYQVFLAQGVGVGLGMGMIYLPSLTLAFHYFKRQRAVAVGLVSTGSAIGGMCQTIGLNHLINGKVGFAWGVRIFAFIFLVLIIISIILMRPRLPPKKLRPGNQPKPDVKNVVRDIPLFLAIIGSGVLLFSVFFPFFYIQLFAILHGVSTNLAFYLITIVNAMTVVGRIIAGLVADRYGYVNTILVSTFFLGIISFTMIKATTPSGLVAFTVFYGLFSGGYFALASSAISSYVDNTHEVGFALGYALFIESFFVLVAQPIAGAIIDAPRYRWTRAIVVVNIIFFGGFLIVLVSRMMLARRRNTWKV